MSKWILGSVTFDINPDWRGGDTGWIPQGRAVEIEALGATTSYIQIDGARSERRRINCVVLSSAKKDQLAAYEKAKTTVAGSDDLGSSFSCIIWTMATQRVPSTDNMSRWLINMELLKR